ncbi:hypothetical protein [Rhizobium alvei]|uniref:Transmembrane protein n=1 Tax=Rhizobium alvei TaxID=1132659 RepID=A0ABT8YJN1_9HYPH|nr:hypothetical protein [Rhizobium alvei]MDO6963913.1 hypothetical protein [Rhizobium alvei]
MDQLYNFGNATWHYVSVAFSAFHQTVNIYVLLLAALAPFLLIYSRNELLIKRLRTILDFMQSFKLYSNEKQGEAERRGPTQNPSFEFVKSKYVSDIRVSVTDQQELDKIDGEQQSSEEEKLKKYIEIATRAGSRSSNRVFVASLGLVIVSYFGFQALLGAFHCDFRAVLNCQAPATTSEHMLVIGALAFCGAFIGALRMLLRCLAVYDLSSFAILRHTGEIVFSVLLIMIIYRAFPDPMANVGRLLLPTDVVAKLDQMANAEASKPATPETPTPVTENGTESTPDATDPTTTQATASAETPKGDPVPEIPWIWFAFAPALGLLPTSASRFLLIKMQSLISFIKTTDDRFTEISRVTSLDIIDGIDFETRFRLEECGICDVQNLATYNPVMLHIETPYGIYQAIDWIAQAQLCHIVGQEKFLMFREINIRTIFDLERAIDSIHSPAAYDDIYAAILFAPSDNLKKAAAISQFRFLIRDTNNVTRQVNVEEYCAWARDQVQPGNKADDVAQQKKNLDTFSEAIEHMMAWISDDLHIRRLRRLWLDISDSLGEDADCFRDSKRHLANQQPAKSDCPHYPNCPPCPPPDPAPEPAPVDPPIVDGGDTPVAPGQSEIVDENGQKNAGQDGKQDGATGEDEVDQTDAAGSLAPDPNAALQEVADPVALSVEPSEGPVSISQEPATEVTDVSADEGKPEAKSSPSDKQS